MLCVISSFILSLVLPGDTLTSTPQLMYMYEQDKHVDGLHSDLWILLKCLHSQVMM